MNMTIAVDTNIQAVSALFISLEASAAKENGADIAWIMSKSENISIPFRKKPFGQDKALETHASIYASSFDRL